MTKQKKIKFLYEEIDFININKKYNDEDNGEIDILFSDDDD